MRPALHARGPWVADECSCTSAAGYRHPDKARNGSAKPQLDPLMAEGRGVGPGYTGSKESAPPPATQSPDGWFARSGLCFLERQRKQPSIADGGAPVSNGRPGPTKAQLGVRSPWFLSTNKMARQKSEGGKDLGTFLCLP